MTISKIFIFVMCLASAASGAVVVAVSTPSAKTCTVSDPDTKKADRDYFSREVIRSPKQGF